MPLQSLKNFTILYCGTRPNTIIPRQSRSVSPVKENNTAEKTKPAPQGSVNPTRQGQRSLTQSTPLYGGQRRLSEKNDSLSNSNNKETVANSQGTTSGSLKSGKSSSGGKTSAKVKPEGLKDSGDSKEAKNAAGTNTENQNDTKKNVDADSTKSEPKKEKVSTIVHDTLSKTTDSLNEATSALGRLSLSLNQSSLTDSLLEEVRLKMTHADSLNSSQKLNSDDVNTEANPNSANANSESKPRSARSSRVRENLERGN